MIAANRLLRPPLSGLPDLHHLTDHELHGVRRARRRPVVTTVLDMIPELHPEFVSPGAHRHKLEVVARSDLIVCISETVRADLDQVVGDVRAPVVVCPLGVAARAPVSTTDRQPSTILFVGQRSGHKLFGVLLDALRGIRSIPVDVVCIGGGGFSCEESAAIGNLPPGISVRQIDAGDAELTRWYSVATVLVSCSIAEGFGLPVLEAMSAGCPVVASDIATYREVAGDAALLVPAGDSAALAEALELLLGNRNLQATLASAGMERASTFTWGRSAELLAAAYRMVS